LTLDGIPDGRARRKKNLQKNSDFFLVFGRFYALRCRQGVISGRRRPISTLDPEILERAARPLAQETQGLLPKWEPAGALE
jgi:hypothetical protein